MAKKILFVILDGVGDIGERTPLKEAIKPTIDTITRNGFSGLVDNKLGGHPDSALSTFVLFGYPETDYPGRGYLEAMGIGLKAWPEAVYLRANFATVEESIKNKMKTGEYMPELTVKDRRAGRDNSGLSELSKDISELLIEGVKVNFYKSVGHRGVVALRSIGISPRITDSDPEISGEPIKEIKAITEDNESIKTASTLNKWSHEVYKILKDHRANKFRRIPANYILLRGASCYRELKDFKEKHGLKGAVVAGSPIVKGTCRALGMDVINVLGATADLKTNLRDKTLAALEALKKHDFVVLHIKGCDIAAHDKNFNFRRIFIEKIDREVFRRLLEYGDFKNTVLVVTSDHLTSTKSGLHMAGGFPFIIFSRGIKPNAVEKLDEENCKIGPVIEISNFMEEVLSFR